MKRTLALLVLLAAPLPGRAQERLFEDLLFTPSACASAPFGDVATSHPYSACFCQRWPATARNVVIRYGGGTVRCALLYNENLTAAESGCS